MIMQTNKQAEHFPWFLRVLTELQYFGDPAETNQHCIIPLIHIDMAHQHEEKPGELFSSDPRASVSAFVHMQSYHIGSLCNFDITCAFDDMQVDHLANMSDSIDVQLLVNESSASWELAASECLKCLWNLCSAMGIRWVL